MACVEQFANGQVSDTGHIADQPLSVLRRGVASSAAGFLSRTVSAACIGEAVLINGYGEGKLAYYGPCTFSYIRS